MNGTMTALVWRGAGELRLEKRPLPHIQDPRDAIVRVTLSSICASDLHIRDGAVPRARPASFWATNLWARWSRSAPRCAKSGPACG